MTRKILSMLLLLTITLPAAGLAESTPRGAGERQEIESDATRRLRRGVRPPRPAEAARVSGRVLDANGQPLTQASVEIAGRSALTDEEGKFTLDVFAGTYTVRVSLVGYNVLEQSITLNPGNANTVVFQLSPAPTAQLRLTNGTILTIDANSVEFGYTVPFVGYVKGPYLDLCVDQQEVRVQVSDIAKVNGPAQAAGNTGCCRFDVTQQISLTLRNASQVTAVMTDTCEGSKMDLIAFDRVEKRSVFIPLTQVQEIVFP